MPESVPNDSGTRLDVKDLVDSGIASRMWHLGPYTITCAWSLRGAGWGRVDGDIHATTWVEVASLKRQFDSAIRVVLGRICLTIAR